MHIKIATGEKVHLFCLHFEQIRHHWRETKWNKKCCTFVWFSIRSKLPTIFRVWLWHPDWVSVPLLFVILSTKCTLNVQSFGDVIVALQCSGINMASPGLLKNTLATGFALLCCSIVYLMFNSDDFILVGYGHHAWNTPKMANIIR